MATLSCRVCKTTEPDDVRLALPHWQAREVVGRGVSGEAYDPIRARGQPLRVQLAFKQGNERFRRAAAQRADRRSDRRRQGLDV